MYKIKCHKCGHTKGIVVPSGLQMKLLCEKCNAYIKFMSKNDLQNTDSVFMYQCSTNSKAKANNPIENSTSTAASMPLPVNTIPISFTLNLKEKKISICDFTSLIDDSIDNIVFSDGYVNFYQDNMLKMRCKI